VRPKASCSFASLTLMNFLVDCLRDPALSSDSFRELLKTINCLRVI